MSQRVHYISGASGVGTSTRAFELRRAWAAAPDARPVFVIATDVVRAQLRTVLDPHDAPDLFGESFNLPARDGDRIVHGVSIDAFLRQCTPILRAVEAGVEYALTEGWDVIAEGVHLVPGAYRTPSSSDAEVTHELVAVDDPDEHLARLATRDAASDGRRPLQHYAANLDRIRVVQSFVRERANGTSR